jgi:hypothetical protein
MSRRKGKRRERFTFFCEGFHWILMHLRRWKNGGTPVVPRERSPHRFDVSVSSSLILHSLGENQQQQG